MKKLVWMTILIAAAAFAQIAPVTVGKAPNSSSYASKVYFAGQPEQADFAEYAKLGVKVVINLRMPAEMEKVSFNEAEAAKAAGLEYVSVPFGSTPVTDANLAKIYPYLAKAGENNNEENNNKVLLHCASSNRAGMVWALFRGTVENLKPEEAIAEGKLAGLKSLEKSAREKLDAAAAAAAKK
jgi:uncharacterized protein (TIGR01244 family)